MTGAVLLMLIAMQVEPRASAAGTVGFELQLLRRNLDAAARYALLIGHPHGIEHQLFAQFYLMTCRPKAAQAEIDQIPDVRRRGLFRAALLSLVSTEHPVVAQKKSAASEKVGTTRYSVANGEIWRDEWPEIELSRPQCAQMPTLADERDKVRARRLAKEEFEKLPTDYFMTDLNILALALDVDADIPDKKRVLDHYADERENPYYARLEAQYRDTRLAEGARPRLNDKITWLSGIEKSEVVLPRLELRKAKSSPHAIQIPVLFEQLDERAGRTPQGTLEISAGDLLGEPTTAPRPKRGLPEYHKEPAPREVKHPEDTPAAAMENYSEKVRQAIESYRPELLGCLPAGNSAASSFDAKITIGANGSGMAELVAAARGGSQKPTSEVSCLLHALSRIAYPAHALGANVVVRLPVSLESDSL